MKQVLLLLCVLAIACGQQVGEDGYTDENRPYEFGFNIEGYQHRHEKKDENGIIMGEFGFITADGIYHVTVYATDENGDFKILKMKNIRVGFPPGTPLMPTTGGGSGSSGRGIAPKSTPLPTSTTARPATSTLNPKFTVASGCGSCKVPITTTRKPQVSSPRPPSFGFRAAVPRGETPETPDSGSPAGGQPPAGGIFGQIPGSNVIGGSPIGQPPGTNLFGSYPNNGSSGNIPFVPNPGTGIFGTGQNNQSSGNNPLGQYPGTNLLGQTPVGGLFGASPPGNQPSDTPIGGQFPGSDVVGSGLGGVIPSNGSTGFPIVPPGGQYPIPNIPGGIPGNGSTGFPIGPPDGQYPIPNIPGGIPGNGSTGFPSGGIPFAPPNGQYPIPNIPGAIPGGANTSYPSPVPGVFGDVPIEPGDEQPGLPNGITENDIKELLYRFNYTAGYHGHHESGYRNGNKEGGYFVNGRDGIGQKVNYLANQFGYQPNITFVELSASETPQEETEKNAGLKGYAFEWFYRKRR